MPLHQLAGSLFDFGDQLRLLRDPTRGGVATTLNEFVENSAFSIELEEEAVPVRASVQGACDLLGLDPLYCANEGKLLAVASPDAAEQMVKRLRELPGGEEAAIIGRVSCRFPGKVVMKTRYGGNRILNKLAGAQLPRIC